MSRLIDADVFEVVAWEGIPEGYNDTFGDGVDWILEKIDAQPTIEPERKMGRWIIRETSFEDTEARCSRCGFATLVNEPGNGLHMVSDLNFCPHCGAYMGDKE